ncbi:MAG: hypothetical protein KDA71_10760 [Planctomycetales bacterium]|nr:hypothetical protein [Planctomycetales bacterium]
MKLQQISLRRSETLTEKWVQEQIADDPGILGLGDLLLKDKERIQPSSGRLDLLLQDPETLKRFEVELQLGATDETHIIRTIEYWDIERRRYPQYEHAAVIVAEDITSRFLNVIQLFNGYIPLIALKMTAYKIGDEYALSFVKVLDEFAFGLVDEDEVASEPTNREFWEKRGSKKTLQFTDALLGIVNEIEPNATLNYNKHYIGIKVGGSAMNFVTFMPRKAHVIMTFKIPQTQEVDEELSEAEIDTMPYDTTWKQYRLRIDDAIEESERNVIHSLAKRAHSGYGKPA